MLIELLGNCPNDGPISGILGNYSQEHPVEELTFKEDHIPKIVCHRCLWEISTACVSLFDGDSSYICSWEEFEDIVQNGAGIDLGRVGTRTEEEN